MVRFKFADGLQSLDYDDRIRGDFRTNFHRICVGKCIQPRNQFLSLSLLGVSAPKRYGDRDGKNYREDKGGKPFEDPQALLVIVAQELGAHALVS